MRDLSLQESNVIVCVGLIVGAPDRPWQMSWKSGDDDEGAVDVDRSGLHHTAYKTLMHQILHNGAVKYKCITSHQI